MLGIRFTRAAAFGIVLILVAFGLLLASVVRLFSAAPRAMSYPEQLAYAVTTWFAGVLSLWAGLKYSSRDLHVTHKERFAAWIAFALVPSSIIGYRWFESFFPRQSFLGAVILFVPLGIVLLAALRVAFQGPRNAEEERSKQDLS